MGGSSGFIHTAIVSYQFALTYAVHQDMIYHCQPRVDMHSFLVAVGSLINNKPLITNHINLIFS